MNVAAAQQDLAGRNPHDAPSRKEPAQAKRRSPVRTHVEKRHDDGAIGHVEIDIARSKPLTGAARFGVLAGDDSARLARGEAQRSWHRQLVHLEVSTACIAGIEQPLQRIARYRVLRITAIVRPGEADLTRGDEAGEIVDVTARLIVADSSAKPHDAADAEIRPQLRLDVLATQGRIAVRVQQTLFGDERRAGAVDVHRAAFIDEGSTIAIA